MEVKNSLIITGTGTPVHVGEKVLSYIDLKTELPFAYPAGCIERDDIILFASRDTAGGIRRLLQRAGLPGDEYESDRGKDADREKAAGRGKDTEHGLHQNTGGVPNTCVEPDTRGGPSTRARADARGGSSACTEADTGVLQDAKAKADTGEPQDAKAKADTGALLFLGVYGNEEVSPIEKQGEGLFPNGCTNTVLMDTVFFGCEVQVIWEGKRSTLSVRINRQTLRCTLTATRSQLLIFSEKGIRYFHDDQPESRIDQDGSILRGGMFHGYFRRNELCALDGERLLNPTVWDCVKKTGPGKETTVFHEGKAVSVKCVKWTLDHETYYEYLFAAGRDILEEMGRLASMYRWLEETGRTRSEGSRMPTTFRLWGSDDNLTKVRLMLQKACNTNVTVLLTGESGTGKTFLAREIHKNSRRHDKSFVHVNCAAIPYQLIESELFGYEEGAFTGARKGGKKGYFEMADGGTIFLDEIAELPLPLQGKLLEVIQSKTFYRVGGTEKICVDMRLIAATNQDLKGLVADRAFREDLYYRIHVFPVELPPLRRRKDAILTIVTDILPEICGRVELEPLRISPQALGKMKKYHWPGNIRELENVLEKAAILCDGRIIMAEDVTLPDGETDPPEMEPEAVTLREQRERCEKKAILAALNRWGGDRGMAAKSLDIGRTNLFEKMKKYNIRSSFTGGEDVTE